MRTEISPLSPGNSKPVIAPEAQALIEGFDTVFFARYNTRLVAGDHEPVYLPADEACRYHRIVFAHGFFASALHEIAHWCIAGDKRRLEQDYGYWYVPDGRNAYQQALFTQVEIKPQALEWLFTQACQRVFYISQDNIAGKLEQDDDFKHAVAHQARMYLKRGMPPRALLWFEFLQDTYGGQPKVEDFYGAH